MSESIVQELLDLSRWWTEYEDVPKSQQTRCIALGKQLHVEGGEDLMREVYYRVKQENRAASVMRYYWDGIGDWRC